MLDFCVQLVSGEHRVTDAVFEKARDAFRGAATDELVATLGYFS